MPLIKKQILNILKFNDGHSNNGKMKYLFHFATFLVVIAPFFVQMHLGKILYIIGLSILSVQAYQHKLHNFIFINV